MPAGTTGEQHCGERRDSKARPGCKRSRMSSAAGRRGVQGSRTRLRKVTRARTVPDERRNTCSDANATINRGLAQNAVCWRARL
jgi:hypothetical protein